MAPCQGCWKSLGALVALITQRGLKFKGKGSALSENQFPLDLTTQKVGECEINKNQPKPLGRVLPLARE